MTRLKGPSIDWTSPFAQSEVARANQGDRIAVRNLIAAHEYPRVLIATGGLLVVFTTLTGLAELSGSAKSNTWAIHAVDLAVAAVLVVIGVLMARGRVSAAAMPWVFAAAATTACLALLFEITLDAAPQSFTYVVLVLCAFGPSSLAWRPFISGVAVILAGALAVTLTWPVGFALDWMLTAVAGAVVGGVLLRFRLRSIGALADTMALAQRLATIDQLTGVLNRHGLMEHTPGLWSTADRLDESVFTVFVDIRGLKQANDRFGHEFGDKVIQAAARAVAKSVRGGDLVARWGGDELLVIGMGRIPEAEAFNERLQSQNEWTGENREKWAGDLSVGFAEGVPDAVSVDDLIRQADEDMYRRRQGQ